MNVQWLVGWLIAFHQFIYGVLVCCFVTLCSFTFCWSLLWHGAEPKPFVLLLTFYRRRLRVTKLHNLCCFSVDVSTYCIRSSNTSKIKRHLTLSWAHSIHPNDAHTLQHQFFLRVIPIPQMADEPFGPPESSGEFAGGYLAAVKLFTHFHCDFCNCCLVCLKLMKPR